jgi:hypothetical protein
LGIVDTRKLANVISAMAEYAMENSTRGNFAQMGT